MPSELVRTALGGASELLLPTADNVKIIKVNRVTVINTQSTVRYYVSALEFIKLPNCMFEF